MNQFSKNLRAAMNNKGMSAIDVAQGLGVTKATVYRYLAGEFYPRLGKLEKLGNILGTSASKLLEGCE